jgi:hypothetical protein
VEKYDRARQATDGMRIACAITKAINSHSECVILIAFPRKNGYANALQCYVIRKLPVFK